MPPTGYAFVTHVTATDVTFAPASVPLPDVTVHVCGFDVGCDFTETAYVAPSSCGGKENPPFASIESSFPTPFSNKSPTPSRPLTSPPTV